MSHDFFNDRTNPANIVAALLRMCRVIMLPKPLQSGPEIVCNILDFFLSKTLGTTTTTLRYVYLCAYQAIIYDTRVNSI